MTSNPVCALLSLLLVACGGGGGSSEPAPPVSSCITGRPVVVELFGDSTNTSESSTGVKIGPTFHLQAYLNEAFGAGQVVVRSKAVGGTTSQQLIDGTDGLNTPWPSTKAGDVVLVNHGLNDGFLDVAPQVYRANVTAFARVGAILQTPLPTYLRALDDEPRIMREVAAATGADLIDLGGWVSAQDWQPWTADKVHPTQDGWKAIVWGYFGPQVAKRVAAKRC